MTSRDDVLSIANPFDFANPVRDPKRLGGRKEELAEAEYYLDQLASGSSYSLALVGERATGKSSLLNALEASAQSRRLLAAQIRLDEAIVGDELEFFREAYESLMGRAAQAGMLGGEAGGAYIKFLNQVRFLDDTPQPADEALAFGRIYAVARSSGKPLRYSRAAMRADFLVLTEAARTAGLGGVCLFIDEANLLAQREDLLQALRNLLMDTPNLMLAIAGTEDMFPALSRVFSPIPRQFVRISVGNLLSVTSTAEIIRNQLAAFDSLWAMPALSSLHDIHRITSGNPYEIVLIAHFMFRDAAQREVRRSMTVSKVTLEAVAEQLKAQNPTRQALAAVLNALPRRRAAELHDLMTLSGVAVETFAIAETAFGATSDETARQSSAARFEALVESFAQTGLLWTEDGVLRAVDDPFALLYLRYNNLGRRSRRRRRVIRDPRAILATEVGNRFKKLLESTGTAGGDPKPKYAVFAIPPELSERDQEFVVTAVLTALVVLAGDDAPFEPAIRAVIELEYPIGVRALIVGGLDAATFFAESVELALPALEAELTNAGMVLGRSDVTSVDRGAIEREREGMVVEQEVDPVADVRREFSGDADIRPALKAVANLALSGELIADTDEVAWTQVNDLAFMSWAVGETDLYLRLSASALAVFPEEPITLLTRALWHAATWDYDKALALIGQTEVDWISEGEVHMFNPSFLDRPDRTPSRTDVIKVPIGAVPELYKRATAAAKEGHSVTDVVLEMGLGVGETDAAAGEAE